MTIVEAQTHKCSRCLRIKPIDRFPHYKRGRGPDDRGVRRFDCDHRRQPARRPFDCPCCGHPDGFCPPHLELLHRIAYELANTSIDAQR